MKAKVNRRNFLNFANTRKFQSYVLFLNVLSIQKYNKEQKYISKDYKQNI